MEVAEPLGYQTYLLLVLPQVAQGAQVISLQVEQVAHQQPQILVEQVAVAVVILLLALTLQASTVVLVETAEVVVEEPKTLEHLVLAVTA